MALCSLLTSLCVHLQHVNLDFSIKCHEFSYNVINFYSYLANYKEKEWKQVSAKNFFQIKSKVRIAIKYSCIITIPNTLSPPNFSNHTYIQLKSLLHSQQQQVSQVITHHQTQYHSNITKYYSYFTPRTPNRSEVGIVFW